MENKNERLRVLNPESTCLALEAPLSDRKEFEEHVDGLPKAERELAKEATRCADLCRYFSEKRMEIPPHIVRQMRQSRTLALAEQLEQLREINSELMEYVHSVSEDSEFRM